MVVIGVDPGSRITGFAVVESQCGRLYHRYNGQLSLSKGSLGSKLAELYRHTQELVTRFSPRELAVEGVFYGRNVKSMLTLGQARGAVLTAAACQGLDIFEYPPTVVKQAVTGYGKADKEQVEKMVRLLLKPETLTGEHAADALAVAVCHLHSASGNNKSL